MSPPPLFYRACYPPARLVEMSVSGDDSISFFHTGMRYFYQPAPAGQEGGVGGIRNDNNNIITMIMVGHYYYHYLGQASGGPGGGRGIRNNNNNNNNNINVGPLLSLFGMQEAFEMILITNVEHYYYYLGCQQGPGNSWDGPQGRREGGRPSK